MEDTEQMVVLIVRDKTEVLEVELDHLIVVLFLVEQEFLEKVITEALLVLLK